MKKAWVIGAALAAAMLAGSMNVSAAPAQVAANDRGAHRGDGDWDRDDRYRDDDYRGGRDRDERGRGYGNSARGFAGTWRAVERSRDDRYRDRDVANWFRRGSTGMLPDMFRIEPAGRGEVRVESMNGALLREGDRQGQGSFRTWARASNGRQIRETFTLERRGQRLVVHTTVTGRGENRTFTTVYARA